MDVPSISRGAEDLAREVVQIILSPDHGLSPFPMSAFFQLVTENGVTSGLTPELSEMAASAMGMWLEDSGYVTLGEREKDGACDCHACGISVLVTASGIAWAAELDSPPWNMN